MKTVEELNQYGLDSLELKALSVPSSLRFLLGIEYDVVLCVNEVGTRRPFRLHFPVFATTFRKLLSLCATRFGLDCEHSEEASVLSGTAFMPLLRYADYLPGALHVKEILECLQVEPATKAKRWRGPAAAAAGEASACASPATTTAGSDSGAALAAAAAAAAAAAGSNEFEASFIDYTEFESDSSLDDVHGQGFYLLLDYGLSLATHSHLVGIRFHKDWDATEALREFQEFSGWSEFDMRFHDEQRRQDGGVIVMPSSQDACDLLEKYEDEDSDDEGDLLPFVLRPVSPLVSVPSLEEAALRKLRDQHWGEVEKHWAHLPRTLNTVVVYNLYDGATLAEVLAFFEPLPILSSTFVEDKAPSYRRRAFITFATLEATRKALDVDGKNTRGCTLRVQVSPPYISTSRRGKPVRPDRDNHPAAKPAASTGACGAAATAGGARPTHGASRAGASPTPSPALRSADATAGAGHTKGRLSGNGHVAAASAAVPALDRADVARARLPPPPGTPTPPYVPPGMACLPPPPPHGPAFGAQLDRAATVAGAIAARAHALSIAAATAPVSPPKSGAGAGTGRDARAHAMTTPGGSHMNAAAKEFVPHFQLSATSPEYRPTPAPKMEQMFGEYGTPAGMRKDGLPPPPPPPPPPAYADAVSPAPEYRPAPRSAHLSHAAPSPSLPAYSLPPPYMPSGADAEDVFPPPPLPPPYASE